MTPSTPPSWSCRPPSLDGGCTACRPTHCRIVAQETAMSFNLDCCTQGGIQTAGAPALAAAAAAHRAAVPHDTGHAQRCCGPGLVGTPLLIPVLSCTEG